MFLTKAQVLEISKIVANYYYLLLKEPRMALESSPGQFMHIRIRESLDPFLRRPFSIAGAFPQEGKIAIIFRIAGEGTRILSFLRKGDYLDCLGPLGRGFKPHEGAAFSMLVAGGVGLAPLLFLAGTLLQEEKKVLLLYGASSRSELIPVEKFLPACDTESFSSGGKIEILRATEDGSLGFRGTVIGLFEKVLKNGRQPDEIFACGPRPMLQALTEKNSRYNYPLQLSLEERMACAMGACQGCAVKIKRNDKSAFCSVCRDGPVFYAHEVIW